MPKGDMNILGIDKNGDAYALWTEQGGNFVKVEAPYTDGSGHAFAMGVLDAGGTSVEAVKAACKRDVYSGGRVRSYKVKK